MKVTIILVLWLGLCLKIFAHGRSSEMIRELNAPVPDWMSVAEPIKVEPIGEQSFPELNLFRPRSGGATNSRNRVQIPERGIEFELPYKIDWRGINEEGYGVSLNPDGTKLLVNNGTTTRLYEISPSGQHREVPIQLPHVTYDEGLKGWVFGWSWAGDDVLVGHAEIETEHHDSLEGRLYVFHMKDQALARLDLSSLDLPDTAGIEIASIGEDLEHLRVRLGDREFTVKANLKSPPRLVAKPDSQPIRETQSIEQPPEPAKSPEAGPVPAEESLSPKWWSVVVVVVALVLLWVLLKMRKCRG